MKSNSSVDLHSAYDNIPDNATPVAAKNPMPSLGWLALNPVDLFRAMNLPGEAGIRVPYLIWMLAAALWLAIPLGISFWKLNRTDL